MSRAAQADWLGPLRPGDQAPEKTTRGAGPDWARLLALAEAADRPMTSEELDLWQRGIIDGNARAWNTEYVHAAAAALTQRQPEQLLKMLMAEIPLPAFLLPVIAAVIEVQAVKPGGRPPKLDPTTIEFIRGQYDHVLDWQSAPTEKERRALVIGYFAKVFGVSTKTIERALK